jgi:hypothetical protein
MWKQYEIPTTIANEKPKAITGNKKNIETLQKYKRQKKKRQTRSNLLLL